MGVISVWGAGCFDNDAAVRWLAEFCDDPNEELIANAFVAITEGGGHTEAQECGMALAAAEVIAALAGAPMLLMPDDARECFAELKRRIISDASRGSYGRKGAARPEEEGSGEIVSVSPAMVAAAVRAVERIRRGSELRELWEEQGAAEWHAAVGDLATRLRQHGSTVAPE